MQRLWDKGFIRLSASLGSGASVMREEKEQIIEVVSTIES